MDFQRLMSQMQGGGAGGGPAAGADDNLTDNSEQVLISSLALLKVRTKLTIEDDARRC